MSTREDVAGLELRIGYTNWRGEYAVRRIRPSTLWFGTTEWHPEAQWFLKARDLDKNKDRDFALKDIGTRPTREDVARLVERLNKAASGIRALSFSEITDADLEAVHYEIRGVADALLCLSAPAVPVFGWPKKPMAFLVHGQVVMNEEAAQDISDQTGEPYHGLYLRSSVEPQRLSAPAEGLETTEEERRKWSEARDEEFIFADAGLVKRLLRDFDKLLATIASEKAKREAAEEDYDGARIILAAWDINSLPNDYTLPQLAEARVADLQKYMNRSDEQAAALKAMGKALRRATDMLSAVAGDIEDGSSLADLRGKYVIALVNCRDDGREALSHYHKHSE